MRFFVLFISISAILFGCGEECPRPDFTNLEETQEYYECQPEFDHFEGTTAIAYLYQAVQPLDLNVALWETRQCLLDFRLMGPTVYQGKSFSFLVEDIPLMLSLWLEFHGAGSHIETGKDRWGFGRIGNLHVWGQADPCGYDAIGIYGPTIQMLQIGPPPYLMVEPKLWTHEFFAHRFLDFLTQDGGRSGHSEEWQATIAPLEQCVYDRVCGKEIGYCTWNDG